MGTNRPLSTNNNNGPLYLHDCALLLQDSYFKNKKQAISIGGLLSSCLFVAEGDEAKLYIYFHTIVLNHFLSYSYTSEGDNDNDHLYFETVF